MDDARLRDMRGRTERLKAAKDASASGEAGIVHVEGITLEGLGDLEGAGKQLEGAEPPAGASASGILPEQLGPPRASEEWVRFYEAIRHAVLKQRG